MGGRPKLYFLYHVMYIIMYMFVSSTKAVEGKGEWVEADEDWITEPGFGSSSWSCRSPTSAGFS